jgi:hypothetical protein
MTKKTLSHAYFNEQRGLKAAEMRKDTAEAIHQFLDRLNQLYVENSQKFIS